MGLPDFTGSLRLRVSSCSFPESRLQQRPRRPKRKPRKHGVNRFPQGGGAQLVCLEHNPKNVRVYVVVIFGSMCPPLGAKKQNALLSDPLLTMEKTELNLVTRV